MPRFKWKIEIPSFDTGEALESSLKHRKVFQQCKCILCEKVLGWEAMTCLELDAPLPSSFVKPTALLQHFGIPINLSVLSSGEENNFSLVDICQLCYDLLLDADLIFGRLKHVTKRMRLSWTKNCQGNLTISFDLEDVFETVNCSKTIKKEEDVIESDPDFVPVDDLDSLSVADDLDSFPLADDQDGIESAAKPHIPFKTRVKKIKSQKSQRIRSKAQTCGLCGTDFHAENEWLFHLEHHHKVQEKWRNFTSYMHFKFRDLLISEVIKFSEPKESCDPEKTKANRYKCCACEGILLNQNDFITHLNSYHNMAVDYILLSMNVETNRSNIENNAQILSSEKKSLNTTGIQSRSPVADVDYSYSKTSNKMVDGNYEQNFSHLDVELLDRNLYQSTGDLHLLKDDSQDKLGVNVDEFDGPNSYSETEKSLEKGVDPLSINASNKPKHQLPMKKCSAVKSEELLVGEQLVSESNLVKEKPQRLIKDCNICHQSIRGKKQFREHMKMMHNVSVNARAFICTHCLFRCKNRLLLEQHMRIAHSKFRKMNLHECERCGRRFAPSLLKNHTSKCQATEKIEKNRIKTKPRSMPKNDDLDYVKATVKKLDRIRSKALACGLCGSRFYVEEKWLHHMEHHHRIQEQWRNGSTYMHTRFRDLIINELCKCSNAVSRVDEDSKNYVCHACEGTFHDRNEFITHLCSYHKMIIDSNLLSVNVESSNIEQEHDEHSLRKDGPKSTLPKLGTLNSFFPKAPNESLPADDQGHDFSASEDMLHEDDGESSQNVTLETFGESSDFVSEDTGKKLSHSTSRKENSFRKRTILSRSNQAISTCNLNEKKGLPMLKCEICHQNIKGKRLLRHHMKKVHNSDDHNTFFHCNSCLFRSKTRLVLEKHWKDKHAEPKETVTHQQCETCGKLYKTSYIREHVAVVHGVERNFICEICGMKFFDRKGLNGHIYYTHSNKQWKCNECDLSFSIYHRYRMHITYNHSTKEFKCDKCDKIYKRKGDLTLHNKRAHENYIYCCNYCPKQYKQTKRLRLHLMDAHGFSKEETYSERYARHKRANRVFRTGKSGEITGIPSTSKVQSSSIKLEKNEPEFQVAQVIEDVDKDTIDQVTVFVLH